MKTLCILLVLFLVPIVSGCSGLPDGDWGDPQNVARYSEDVRFFVKIGTRIAIGETAIEPEQVEPLVQYFQTAKELLLDPEGPSFDAARALALAQFDDDRYRFVAVAVIDVIERYAANHLADLGNNLGPLQVVLGAAVDGAIEALTEFRDGARGNTSK